MSGIPAVGERIVLARLLFHVLAVCSWTFIAAVGVSGLSRDETQVIDSLKGVASVGDNAGRIQKGNLNLPALNIVDDPMTEVIEIVSENGQISGTGNFVDYGTGDVRAKEFKNCHVLTALHVLLDIKSHRRRRLLNFGESFVGERFKFLTNPIPELGQKRLEGTIVVVGHGDLTNSPPQIAGREDWAVGVDEECLAGNYGLGYIRISTGSNYLEMLQDEESLTAGHTRIPAAM